MRIGRTVGMVLLAAMACLGTVAAAADYPPGGSATPSSSTFGVGGGNVVVNITGCQSDAPAEALTATLATSTATATCTAAGAALNAGALNRTGTASFTLKAPTAAGTYTGTVVGNQGFAQSFQIQVTGLAPPPTQGGGVGVSNTSPAPGTSFTVSLDICRPGVVVTVVFDGVRVSVTADAFGEATVQLVAPSRPGLYVGRVTCAGEDDEFSVRVTGPVGFDGAPTDATPSAVTPATGSDATVPMTLIASGLLAIGLGLLGVAQFRRRQEELLGADGP